MTRLTSPYLQYRQTIGTHYNWQNKTCPTQKQQDNCIKKLASQPGLHSGNVHRQNMTQSMIQCFVFLASIRNCDASPTIAQNTGIQVKNTLPFKGVINVNTISQETGSESNLIKFAQPVVHLLEHTDRLMAHYDPLRFPMAEAIPTPLGEPVPLSDFKNAEFTSGRFNELENMTAFSPEGEFYDQNIEKSAQIFKYMKVTYKGKNYLIKENERGDHYLFDPTSTKPRRTEVRVYFHTNDNKVHLGSDLPSNRGFRYAIIDGSQFAYKLPYIEVGGKLRELNYNWDINMPEIVGSNGYIDVDLVWHPTVPTFLGVYMEPISKTWHLEAYNGKAVFTIEQKKILSRISVNQDDHYVYIPYPNDNPKVYGAGKIYRAEKKNDHSHYSWGQYIEMNGKLIPVHVKVVPGNGVYYEIYDTKDHLEKVYPVRYQGGNFLNDGNKWVFE